MSNSHQPHFPVAILTYNGGLILGAAQAHAEIPPRLAVNYLADAVALLAKVSKDVSGQKTAKGELGNLTAAQATNLNTLQHWMNQARKTAKLAFPGQTVKLHEEFQVGIHAPHDLGSFLSRADIILASLQTAINVPALKLKGWTDAETTSFTTIRQTFGPAEVQKESAKGGAKDFTGLKNTDAASLYEHLLTIQNAADLQWPATVSANAGVRDEFRLNTFPPAGGNSTPPPTPPLPPPEK